MKKILYLSALLVAIGTVIFLLLPPKKTVNEKAKVLYLKHGINMPSFMEEIKKIQEENRTDVKINVSSVVGKHFPKGVPLNIVSNALKDYGFSLHLMQNTASGNEELSADLTLDWTLVTALKLKIYIDFDNQKLKEAKGRIDFMAL